MTGAGSFSHRVPQHARRTAEAGTEGGLLGFGGVAVSDKEKATLAEISAALGSSIQAAGQSR